MWPLLSYCSFTNCLISNQSFKKLLYFFPLFGKSLLRYPLWDLFPSFVLVLFFWFTVGRYQLFALCFVFIAEKKNRPLRVRIWSVQLHSWSPVRSLALITVPGWPPAQGRVPWQKSENSSISDSLFWIYGVFRWIALCWACSCWKGGRLGWEEEFVPRTCLQPTVLPAAAAPCPLPWTRHHQSPDTSPNSLSGAKAKLHSNVNLLWVAPDLIRCSSWRSLLLFLEIKFLKTQQPNKQLITLWNRVTGKALCADG